MPVKLKSWNWQTVAIGRPGSGKSYWLRRFAWAEAQRIGAYVLVADPTGSWAEDSSIPKQTYSKVADLAKGIAERGGRVAHVLEVPAADAVLQAGIALAKASMDRAAAERKSTYAPVMVIVDEVVTAGGVRSHGLSDMWMDAIARRRHHGIGIGITSQSAYFAHRTVLSMATRIECFGIVDPADADRLMAMGLDKPLAARLRTLEDREHITVINGRVTAINDKPYHAEHGRKSTSGFSAPHSRPVLRGREKPDAIQERAVQRGRERQSFAG